MRKRAVGGGLAVTMLLAVSLGMLGASSALAAEHHPTGEYAQFKDCPDGIAVTELCLLAKIESGKIAIGKLVVPIEKTITLQGGIREESEIQRFIGPEGGETLSRTPQSVPGGLRDLVDCEIGTSSERSACNQLLASKSTGVTATAELAGPPSSIAIDTENLSEGEGVALALPVKVHLENPQLGSTCYIGSNVDPMEIALTSGTTSSPAPNEPITGKVGHVTFNPAFTIATIKEDELVSNSFSAPGVEGCDGVFSLFVDRIIDREAGLPATAGHNTARLMGTLQEANAKAVKTSEN